MTKEAVKVLGTQLKALLERAVGGIYTSKEFQGILMDYYEKHHVTEKALEIKRKDATALVITIDETKQYTTMESALNYNLKKQVTNLPHIRVDGDKEDIAYDLAKDLAALWDSDNLQISPRYTTTYTFDEYYREMVGALGIIGSTYETAAQDLGDAVEEIDHQRSGVIGVSSDEELTKRIKYQNAYNASSRYIQVVSDMIEALVTGL